MGDHPQKGSRKDLVGVDNANLSSYIVSDFIIFGFPSLQTFSLWLFCVFLIIYLLTLTGNATILFLVVRDQKLQTAMYFFVSNLSILDTSYTTLIIPKMLAKFSMGLDRILCRSCFFQMYFFFSLGVAECFLLAVMAYDRYLAITSPLHYHSIMSKRLCICLCLGSWVGGLICPITALILVYRLPFCGPNIIYHYYCDHPPLLQLACTDTTLNVIIGSSLSAGIILLTFLPIVTSYIKIVMTIFKITSREGRRKTFSTCASHFLVVSLFYLPLIFMYVRPTASYSTEVDSLVALLYTVLTPMMNPMIYSLRNADIKEAFKKKLLLK